MAVIFVLISILLLLTIWLLFNSLSPYHVEQCIPLQSFVLAAEVGMDLGRELWAEGKQFENDYFHSSPLGGALGEAGSWLLPTLWPWGESFHLPGLLQNENVAF